MRDTAITAPRLAPTRVSCANLQMQWGNPAPAERPETTHEELEVAIPCDAVEAEVAGPVRRPSPPKRGLPDHLLRRAVDFIRSNLSHDLSLGELARAANLSPFYFARLFKQSTGIAPHGYVMARRIERAKELLHNGMLPIVEVALETGFADQSHMTGVFRKLTGVTPRNFRPRPSTR
jgi:AraC-like DNA-binding protein